MANLIGDDETWGAVRAKLNNFGLPTPVTLDKYSADSGYTYGGSPASHNIRATTEPSPLNSGIEFVSTAAATATMSIAKATSFPIIPAKAGVLAALVKVNGKKSGRVLNIGGNNVILADNPTTSLVRNGWMWISAHASEFPTFYALTDAQVVTPSFLCQLTGNDGVTTAAIRYMLAQAAGRPSIRLSFDDITSDQAQYAFPIMDARKVVGTIYVPSAWVGNVNKLTLDQLKARRDLGWSIACDSTPDDSLTNTTATTAVNNLQIVRDYLVSNGLAVNGSENHGCWTMGTWTEALCAAFEAAGMETMRGTSGSLASNLKYIVHDRFGLGDIAMTTPSFSGGVNALGSSFDNMKTAADLAVLRGGNLGIHFHTFTPSGASGAASDVPTFEAFVNYIADLRDAGTLDTLSITDWYARVQRARLPLL